ncbi:MAG: hypothetical protein JST84_25620 [Acidobacteria bacterium]|nr:hypothetical protein [Acidobacteriota bacterium]
MENPANENDLSRREVISAQTDDDGRNGQAASTRRPHKAQLERFFYHHYDSSRV